MLSNEERFDAKTSRIQSGEKLICDAKGFEAIVFVTKYHAHQLQQAPGLGRVGDRVRTIKNMYKNSIDAKNNPSSGLRGFSIDLSSQASQLIPSDIHGFRISAHLHYVSALTPEVI